MPQKRINKWFLYSLCGGALILVSAFIFFSKSMAVNGDPELEKNLKELRAVIAQKGYQFTVGWNDPLHRSRGQLCGLKVPKNWRQLKTFKKLEAIQTLPASLDWRDYEGVSNIRDQGYCGSCWAFSTVGILESKIKRDEHVSDIDLSEQYLVSCNDDNWGCDGGYFAHYMHQSPNGAITEASYPYTASDSACTCNHRYVYRINTWYYIAGSEDIPTVDQIKTAIYQYGPVAVSVYVDDLFQYYTDGIFEGNASGEVNHAVNLVGWNDNYDGTGKGVWILKNSWGTSWGEDGYMYIKYGSQQVGFGANYIEEYVKGDWSQDTNDPCGGCSLLNDSAEAQKAITNLKKVLPGNSIVRTIDFLVQNHDPAFAKALSSNPSVQHMIIRGIVTNMKTMDEFTKTGSSNKTLNLNDLLLATQYLRNSNVPSIPSEKLDHITVLIKKANGKSMNWLAHQ